MTLKLEEFIKNYEIATNSHDFSKVKPLIEDNAIFYFSDGSFTGVDNIRQAFEKTWEKVKNEIYLIKDVEWLVNSDKVAVCVYNFHWTGSIDGLLRQGNGRGTNVLIKTDTGWKIMHEHLSKQPLE